MKKWIALLSAILMMAMLGACAVNPAPAATEAPEEAALAPDGKTDKTPAA